MRFTVAWDDEALDLLAAIWAVSKNRRAVAEASNQIEMDLRNTGEAIGRVFSANDYFHDVGPIGVVFQRSMDDRLIRVTDVLTRKSDQS